VGSTKAGQRVMALLGKLYEELKLQINEAKSAVARALGRKFLGYELWGQKAMKSNVPWPTRPRPTSRPASGNSHAARAGAAWSKWCSG
jgi:hypothetical protein